MRELKFSAFRIIVNAAFAALLVFAYFKGVDIGMGLVGIDIWFVRITLGLLGITFALAIFRWVRTNLMFVLKSCTIYSVCCECDSILESMKSITVKFGSTLTVTVLNKLIRSSLGEILDLLHNQDTDIPDVLKDLLSTINNSVIFKISKSLVVKSFDYVDECVLGYCYKNKEIPLYKAAINAIAIFLLHSADIIAKVATVAISEIVLRFLFYVVCIFWCIKFGYFSIENVVMYYIIVKSISFIIEDSILEPVMMSGILREFIKYDDVEIDKIKEDLIGIVPSIEKLNNMKQDATR